MKKPEPTPSPADLSVVIPQGGNSAALADTLAALAEQRGLRLEVLVADDAPGTSRGEVTENFRRQGLNVSVYSLPGEPSPLASRLRGMELATAPWLTFMADDIVLTGPEACAEALRTPGDADILHVLTLAKNRWGLSTLDEALAPLAEKPLTGAEIFPAWLDAGCKAPVLWNKFYSQRLYRAATKIPHTLHMAASGDLYLSAWFFLLAQGYAAVGVPVYEHRPPKKVPPETCAARALDCLRMYLELPSLLTARGLPEEQAERFRQFLRQLVAANGATMCEYLLGGADGGAVVKERLEQVLHFGTEEEVFLALAVANGSNAEKLMDVSHILRFSW